jgi:hypothetical protein
MSDSISTDNISETITNVFKKTELFKKIEKIEFYVGSFVIVSSIIGITSIYMNYCNFNKIENLKEQIKGNENVLKYNIEINRKQNQVIYNKLIEQLKSEIENTSRLIDKIKVLKPEMISASTSVSSFAPLKVITSHSNNHIIQEDIEDDELINECYDSIPLNNVKKTTGLSWLFK